MHIFRGEWRHRPGPYSAFLNCFGSIGRGYIQGSSLTKVDAKVTILNHLKKTFNAQNLYASGLMCEVVRLVRLGKVSAMISTEK